MPFIIKFTRNKADRETERQRWWDIRDQGRADILGLADQM